MNSAFFDVVRAGVFNGRLTQSQVDGISTILRAWAKYGDGNLQRQAYTLATPVIETAWRMEPIHEYGGVSYFDKYEPGTKLGEILGNTKIGDGHRYRGRGYVQITGRSNYERAGKLLGIDLINKPDLALDPEIAARILVVGSQEGWFTGKGLPAFIDDIDDDDEKELQEFAQARRVINGQDRAVEIGKIALVFERALKAGKAANSTTASTPIGPPSVIPIPSPEVRPGAVPGWSVPQSSTQGRVQLPGSPTVAPTDVEAPPQSTPLQALFQLLAGLILALVKAFRR